jgi:hypothetical protein
MRIGRGNRSTRRKPAPIVTFSTTNPTLIDLGSNRAATVGSRRLTAWDMARPESIGKSINHLASQLACISMSVEWTIGQSVSYCSVSQSVGISVNQSIITPKRWVVPDMEPRPIIYKRRTIFFYTVTLNTAIQASVCWQKLAQITTRRPPTSASRDGETTKKLIPAPSFHLLFPRTPWQKCLLHAVFHPSSPQRTIHCNTQEERR